jgi:hypothetical protein
MDVLESHYISIDSWSVLFPEETTFLLSHLHTDHANIPKSFTFPVYASEVTGHLISTHSIRPVLVPNEWYRTHIHHIPFQVHKTMHTVESIGFYFPSLSVLYMGDATQSIIESIPRPLTVIYDGLYEHLRQAVPTIAQSCTHIQKTLKDRCPVLQIVHHGILSFIAVSCHTMFRLHGSLPILVQKAARFLNLVDDKSPYLLVGKSYVDGPRIVPSSYWFMRTPSISMFSVHQDGDKLRIFCNLHASSQDIRKWKAMHTYAYFETLVTNPV